MLRNSNRSEIRKHTLNLLKKGNSITVLGINGIGKNDFLNELSLGAKAQAVPLSINVTELVRISDADFFRAMLLSLINLLKKYPDSVEYAEVLSNELNNRDPFLLLNHIKDGLRKLLESMGESGSLSIVIFDLSKLANLPPSFFNSIRTVREVNKGKIAFLFVDSPAFIHKLDMDRAGELFELMHNTVIWLPLADSVKFDEIILNCEKNYGVKLKPRVKEFIHNISGGHAGITKYLVLYFSHSSPAGPNIDDILRQDAIQTRLQKIVEDLAPLRVNLLKNLHFYNKQSIGAELQPHFDKLVEMQILKKEDGGYKFTIPLLESYLTSEIAESFEGITPTNIEQESIIASYPPPIQIKSGIVSIGGSTLTNDLSKREFGILQYMVDNRNKVIPREQIAKVIWEEEVDEKYSNWAIDQLISRLRRKIGDNGYAPKYIKTVKGRGFRLEI